MATAAERWLRAQAAAQRERQALRDLFLTFDETLQGMIDNGKFVRSAQPNFQTVVDHHNSKLMAALHEMNVAYRELQAVKTNAAVLKRPAPRGLGSGRVLLKQKSYTPNKLLNTVAAKLGITDDAVLCQEIGVHRTTISNIRNRRMAVSSALIVRMHEVTGMSIRELRQEMGDTGEQLPYEQYGAAA